MTFCIFSQHQSFMDKLAPFHLLNPYSVHKPQTHMPPRSHSPTSISLAMPDTHLFSSSSTPFTSPKFSPSFHPLDELSEERTLNSVRELHAQMLKMPKKGSLSLTTMDGNMIRYYLEFGDFVSAIKVFFVGFARSYSLWNSFLEEFGSFGGDPYEILEVFKELFSKGVEFDSKALTVVLKICLDLRDLWFGLEIHACLIKRGFLVDVHLSCALINLYEKCWGIDRANQVFHETPCQEDFLWNTIVMANLRSERWWNALELFRSMQSTDAKATTGTIVKLLQACGKLRALNEGKQIHGYALKFGLVSMSNTLVCSSIISMYSRNRRLKLARAVFDSMEDRNLASWNSIILSYAIDGCLNDALDMIKEMEYSGIKPDIITWNSLLSGYLLQGSFEKVLTSFQNLHGAGFKPDSQSVTIALQAIIELGLVKLGKEIHGYIMRSKLDYDVHVCTSLVDMYVKNDCLDKAKVVFHHTKNKNVVLWTALISGCSQNEKYMDALQIFSQMQAENVKPNSTTVCSLLHACAGLFLLKKGEEIHCFSMKVGFVDDIYIATALIDMYSKAGKLKLANEVFRKVQEKTLPCWTCMMRGYAIYGHGEEVVILYDNMCKRGIRPDALTFKALLSGCKNSGLVDEGRKYFDSMQADYNIIPTIEHYCCMVELLGKAGFLDEAMDFIKTMPFKPSASIWRAFLASCRIHKNIKLAEIAARNLFKLEPYNSANYALMMNIYSTLNRWDDVKRLQDSMTVLGMKIPNVWSWTQINQNIHVFSREGKPHPEKGEIYFELYQLVSEIRKMGYVPDVSCVYRNIDDTEKEKVLLSHTEKLAMVYGVMKMKGGSPIRVVKNTRTCHDCHTVAKYISLARNREIFLRDGSRFHHFKNGKCSCNDRW